MRCCPPAQLVERLGRLHLATPGQLEGVGARVRRLAGEFTEFESVWIDALAQARIITAWQAEELNAGRGERLLCGNYLLTARLPSPGYAECYAARNVESGQAVRLYLCHRLIRSAAETASCLSELTGRASSLGRMPALYDCGTDGRSVWAVCNPIEALPLGQWLQENGRLPPVAVLQIARAMAVQLALLEAAGLVHGDLGPLGLLVDGTGDVWLPAPGLRGAVRPNEGLGFGDLPPQDYDYLAPERIRMGSAPDVASDIYACGALWWHLLAGRPAFPGANARAKQNAIQAARVIDIRSLAQGVPQPLADCVMQCLATDRSARPASFAALVEQLGRPTDAGRQVLASLQKSTGGAWHGLRRVPARRSRGHARRTIPLLAGSLLALGLVSAPFYFRRPASSAEQDREVATATTEPDAARAEEREDKPAGVAPIVDAQVRPAAAHVPIKPLPPHEPVQEDLVLPTGELLQIEQFDLEPGIRVRGRGGRRPLVAVPAHGLLVDQENVTFEGIDFVWQVSGSSVPSSTAAMIRLQAQKVSFRGCSFSTRASAPPAAIELGTSRDRPHSFGSEVALQDCVVDGVSRVVDCRVSQSLTVRLENCLCVASGPILSLARFPVAGSSVELTLTRVTTRGDASVLALQQSRMLAQPGRITITANGSALAGISRAGLISLRNGTTRPEVVRSIAWEGQGSVLTPRTPMVAVGTAAGAIVTLADDELAVAGLVRGELEFAGRADGPPADSRVVRWQVPLRSPEPPGADPDRLHSPRSLGE